MRSVVMVPSDRIQRLIELRFIGDRESDAQEIGALDFEAVLDLGGDRAVVIVQIALRSRIGCFIAS